MHVVTLTKETNTGPDFGVLAPGEWVMHDQNAFELAMIAERGTVSMKPFSKCEASSGFRRTLIVRSGAWGDLLLLSPALAELFNGSVSTLACATKHHSLFSDSCNVDLMEYPFRPEKTELYDEVIDLGNVLELNRELHCTDAFARALGMSEIKDYRPRYTVTDSEAVWAFERYKTSTGVRRVGIQMGTSHPNKMYPLAAWLRVVSILESRGWEVMLLGTKNELPPLKPTSKRVHACYTEDFTFRESAAILSTCDAFAGVDSVFLHMCHALDIPAIGLFGSHPWELYTSKAPKTRALTGAGECSPCFHYKRGPWFPRDQECFKLNQCTVLSSIKAETIAAKVDALVSK